ncbi:hypothetical protein NA56DRAFT_704154 [Hyaloscypha hepaticicola]|uniref:Uncharacterized protein n=1 Tax=Hyaloscypha hepaticicola TaxID=2082293 RepID=A0A2J6Q3R8_9HELO|nr:hypothetical protein NA56DRAFT_704154 [Hyaloscypha hepaticicola]
MNFCRGVRAAIGPWRGRAARVSSQLPKGGLINADNFSGTHGPHQPQRGPCLLDSKSRPRSLVYGVTYGMGQRVEEPIAAVLAETSSPDVGDAASLDLHSHGFSMLLAYLCLGSFAVVDRAEDRLHYATLGRDASCLIRIAHVQRREAQRRELRDASMHGVQGPTPPESGMLMTWKNDTRR